LLSLDQVGLKNFNVEGSLTTGVKIELGGKLAFGLADAEGYHMVSFDLEVLMDGLTVEAGWNDEHEKCKAIVKAEVDFVAIEVELIFSKNGPDEQNVIDINNKVIELYGQSELWVGNYKADKFQEKNAKGDAWVQQKYKPLQLQHKVLMGDKWVPAPELDNAHNRVNLDLSQFMI